MHRNMDHSFTHNSPELSQNNGQRQNADRPVVRLTQDQFSFHSDSKTFPQSTSLAVRARLHRHFTRAVTSTSNFLPIATQMHLHSPHNNDAAYAYS